MRPRSTVGTHARGLRSTLPAPEGGEILAGKYRVEGPLPDEPACAVVLATALADGRVVEVRIAPGDLGGERERGLRLVREARIASQLRSVHAARVVDAGMLGDGAVFVATETVDGTDAARALVERGPFDVAAAVEHALAACDALAEAHAAGILHRDLRPERLVLAKDATGHARVKLLGLGLGELAAAGDMGWPPPVSRLRAWMYQSPEQIAAPRAADVRSDVWGIGAVLFELLTGRPAFDDAGLLQILARALTGSPRSARELRADLPPGLERAVLRCLERDLERRPHGAAAVARALSAYAAPSARVAPPSLSGSGRAPTAPDAGVVAGPAPGLAGPAPDQRAPSTPDGAEVPRAASDAGMDPELARWERKLGRSRRHRRAALVAASAVAISALVGSLLVVHGTRRSTGRSRPASFTTASAPRAPAPKEPAARASAGPEPGERAPTKEGASERVQEPAASAPNGPIPTPTSPVAPGNAALGQSPGAAPAPGGLATQIPRAPRVAPRWPPPRPTPAPRGLPTSRAAPQRGVPARTAPPRAPSAAPAPPAPPVTATPAPRAPTATPAPRAAPAPAAPPESAPPAPGGDMPSFPSLGPRAPQKPPDDIYE